MTIITDILRHHPELAVFMALGLGFFFGKFKIGTFVLGPILGTLFAGLLIGQLDIPVPAIVKVIFFDLFLLLFIVLMLLPHSHNYSHSCSHYDYDFYLCRDSTKIIVLVLPRLSLFFSS